MVFSYDGFGARPMDHTLLSKISSLSIQAKESLKAYRRELVVRPTSAVPFLRNFIAAARCAREENDEKT
jgi:hypothetical protein